MDETQLEFFPLDQYTQPVAGFSDWEVDVGQWEESPLPNIKVSDVTDSDRSQSVAFSTVGEYSPTTPEKDTQQYSQEDFNDLTTLSPSSKEFTIVLKRASIITLLVAKEYLSKKSRPNKERLKRISRRVHTLEWQIEITGFEGEESFSPSSDTSNQGDLEASRPQSKLAQTLKLPTEGNPHRGNFQVLTSVVPEPQSWDDLGTTSNISEERENSGLESSQQKLASAFVTSHFTSRSPTHIVSVGESTSEIPKKKQERTKPKTPEEGSINLNTSQPLVDQEESISSPKSEIKASPSSRKLGSFLLMSYQPSKLEKCPYWYLRLSWKENDKVKTLHIPGGNADSDLVKERVRILERAVKSGLSKSEIIDLVKSWRKPRQNRRKSKRSNKKSPD